MYVDVHVLEKPRCATDPHHTAIEVTLCIALHKLLICAFDFLCVTFFAAYYAHWAARRGKVLMNAGVDSKTLEALSSDWIKADMPATMYFI